MPHQPPKLDKQVTNVVYDLGGGVILHIGALESTLIANDGTVTTFRTNQNIQLVCGSIYNAAMSMGAHPIMLLQVCETCRNPTFRLFGREEPTHGLCNAAVGHICVGCGTFCCPRHAVAGRNGQARCHACARHHRRARLFRRALRALLTYEQEE